MHDAASFERARSALSYLNFSDRDVWVRAAMCIKNEFGEEGFELWDSWGAQSDNYSASAAKSVWKSIRADGKTTIASLFYDAKSSGWVDTGGHKKPTKAEVEARRAAAAKRAEQAAAEEAQEQAEAASRAQAIWDAAEPCEAHPYLDRKGVASYGLRVGRWERTDSDTGEVFVHTEKGLLIPIRDRQRGLWSLQCIHPNADKKKLYLKGGAKRGHFFAIGKPQQRDGRNVFVLVEGYATGASVHVATGHMVLVCFDTSNLLPVAQGLRERQPDAVIVFAADNDTETDGNPGVTRARAAAAAVGGLVAIPPPGDFNDLQVAEGVEAVAGAFETAFAPPAEPDAGPEPEPVEDAAPPPPAVVADDDELASNGHFTILGYDEGNYWFFVHSKLQVLSRTRHDFTDSGLIEMAPTQWWEMYFPGNKGGINKNQALEWALAVAHKRGIYDPARIRGRGAWTDKGRSVFHHGSYLVVDGVSTGIAQHPSRWVYSMSRSFPQLDVPPLTDAEGQHLLEVAKLARWKRPGSAALLAGWVFLSPLCGSLAWRPHIWLTGPAGSGKSTIFSDYVNRMLDGISVPLNGDSSEAGIRQLIRADAVPALIDEFEPNSETDRRRMKSVLTLMRQASSESAAQTAKGTITGDGVQFHIRSMFCVASVNTMIDKDSDQSRITVLELRPPAKSGDAGDNWVVLQEELHKLRRDPSLPARNLARGLSLLKELGANVEVFCRVAAKVFGTQRLGDQYGTLLAGAWTQCYSAVATDAQAKALIDGQDWTEHTDSGDNLSDPEKALAAIMEAKVRVGSTDVTIFEILAEAAGRPVSSTTIGGDAAVDLLRRNGIRLEGQTIVFGVSTGHLKNLVKDTAYATDIRGQLSRLPGAGNMNNKTRKFAGVNSKIIGIPLARVMDDDEPPI